MSDTFFESAIVRDCLEDIMVLQSEVMLFAEYGLYATIDQQKENLKVLRMLLSKQKNMFVRCQLATESPGAKHLASEIINHFADHGYEIPENPIDIFDMMAEGIDGIEQDILEYEDEE